MQGIQDACFESAIIDYTIINAHDNRSVHDHGDAVPCMPDCIHTRMTAEMSSYMAHGIGMLLPHTGGGHKGTSGRVLQRCVQPDGVHGRPAFTRSALTRADQAVRPNCRDAMYAMTIAYKFPGSFELVAIPSIVTNTYFMQPIPHY